MNEHSSIPNTNIRIMDTESHICVDLANHPYFKDYEIAVCVESNIILMLQYGEVIASADSSRYQVVFM